MSLFRINSILEADVPTPDVGKSVMFLSADDGKWKVKKSDTSIVSLEDPALATADAEDVTYTTNDVSFWSWDTAVPTDAETAFDDLAAATKDCESSDAF